jgi:putative ABC transport system permease protein
VVASIVPAYEATVVSPGSAISRLSFEIGFSRLLPKLTLLGLSITSVGGGVLLFPSKNIILGFVGLFGLVTGLALIVLVSTKAVFGVTRRISSPRFSITSFLAIKLLAGSVSRVSLAVAALSMAVSLTVGIGVMVQSFRLTVDHWLETSLGTGIYVSPASMSLTRFDSTISPEALVRLNNIDGITDITSVRHVMVDTALGASHLVAADTDFESFSRPAKFKKGNPHGLWEEFNNSDIVLISEPFAYHRQLTVGDSFEILTDYGYKEFRVAGIQYDYSSSSGIITVSKQTYGKYWEDKNISSVRLHVSSSQEIDSLIEEIYESTQNIQPLQIRSNDVLRKSALEVFDRSFTITSVMRYIAVLVALIGVVGALMALQLERAREYGIAGAIGFIPLQIRKVVMVQTSLIGLLAGLFSLPIGILLAYGLVHVVNERSFGWSMELYISYKVLFEAILISLVGSILAGVYPAVNISRSSLGSQLSES